VITVGDGDVSSALADRERRGSASGGRIELGHADRSAAKQNGEGQTVSEVSQDRRVALSLAVKARPDLTGYGFIPETDIARL
jgi:hypothetical protein